MASAADPDASSRDASDVVVIGGGLAGLAAAARLAPSRRVTVLEAGATLGGQCAGAWQDGHARDLGVHGIYPRYTELEALLAACGVPLSTLIAAKGQCVITPGGLVSPVRMPPVPAPFHGLVHASRLTGVNIAERARLLLSVTAVLAADPDADHLDRVSFQDFAARAGVPRRAFRLLFEPLALLGFFLAPDQVAAGTYLSALRFLLTGRHDSWQARWVPSPNGDTLVTPIAAHITRRGGCVRTGCAAIGLVSDGTRVTAVRFVDEHGVSREIGCRAVVCAVQPAAAATLVATIPGPAGVAQAAELRALGITWVHTLRFRFARGPAPRLHHGVALTERAGFAFLSVGAFMPAYRGERVIEVQCGQDGLCDDVLDRVRGLLPDGDLAPLLATDDTGPIPYARYGVGGAASRPAVHSPWLNLYFSGDWVHDGSGAWFMERAVRTGRSAAAAILGVHLAPAPHPPFDGPMVRLTRAVLRNMLGMRP